MFQYIVRLRIEKSIEPQWVEFMRAKHIQDVLDTGFFSEATLKKTIVNITDNYSAYSVEYTAESLEAIENYRTEFSPALQKEVMDLFEGKFSAEREVVEIIQFYN